MKSKRTDLLLRSIFILFMLLSPGVMLFTQAQDKKSPDKKTEIRGTITDSSMAVMPGVSVSVKGNSQIGTTSDLNGKYILEVPAGSMIVFSMVGFGTQEILSTGKSVINVTMRSSANQLEDVVVTVAFGKQKKREVVGSVTSIDPGELKIPSSNLTTALAGRMAGVVAYQRSGEPGADNANFFIRGVTTFGYKTDPLILVDNIELTATDLARLQPDDIASFAILKDATATALYGARGANGIILITTKKGKEGKAKINLRIENSVSQPTRNIELADPVTYMKLGNEAVLTRNPLGILPYSQYKIDNTIEGTNPYMFPATDWRKELFKDYTMNQRANFSVTGGSQTTQYYLSASMTKDNGMLKVPKRSNFNNNIDLRTYLLRSNVNINLTKTTEAGIKLYGSFDEYNGPIDGGTTLYNKIMRTNPVFFPAYYPVDAEHAHTQHILFGNFEGGNYINPYADMVKGYKDYSRSLMLAQFELKQNLAFITQGLNFSGIINTTRRSYFDVSRFYNPFYYQATNYDPAKNKYSLTLLNEAQGTEYLNYREGQKLISSTSYIEASLNYNRTFEKHGVSSILVLLMNNRLDANSGDLQTSLPYRNIGLSGRFTYSFDRRYFAEFNFGYNGSERFYDGKRFGFFPSAGIAWAVSNEKFWKPLEDIVTNLKLRATYGLVGNDAIGGPADRFFYLSNVNMEDGDRGATFGTNYGYSRTGISISRYDNKEITWEVAQKVNLGMEISLWNKLNVIAEVFRENRSKILMNRSSIPNTAGLQAAQKSNVGEASGEGMDISVDYSLNLNKDIWLQARGNFTYATSSFKVYDEPDYAEKYLSRIGYSLNQTWGYVAERLFVDDADVANSPRQNFGEYMAGDIKYRDLNGDGVITSLDRVPIGFPTVPEIVYGFGFSAGYKNLDLSCFFQGSARSSFYIDAENTSPFVENQALLKAYSESYWSEDNRNIYALWPRLSNTPINNNLQASTWFLRNGAFLRLKTVELGYSFPRKLISKVHLTNARIYASGINLLTFSPFKLWDVEMGGNGLGYPVQRVINVGLNINF